MRREEDLELEDEDDGFKLPFCNFFYTFPLLMHT
jgi:hypothetical protein